jgi:hypothetical protein
MAFRDHCRGGAGAHGLQALRATTAHRNVHSRDRDGSRTRHHRAFYRGLARFHARTSQRRRGGHATEESDRLPAAGCTVLSTHIDRQQNGEIRASISIRIAPDRYQAFAAAITAPPATLLSHTETAEDKTVPLLDIEKRLDAQLALRDRLSQILKQAGTSVADLVAVEKQLADVQGTIESDTAQREYLRTITDTVKVDVSYNGVIQQAGPFDISPIRIALDNFLRTLIDSLGTLIICIAAALPWLPLAALAGWILRLLLRPFGRRTEGGAG